MPRESDQSSQAAEVETVAAARIQYDVIGRCSYEVLNRIQQRLSQAPIVQPPPPLKRGHCVARLLRSPILRLEQIDVSTTRRIERMTARTNHSPLLAPERQVAIADRTE